MERIYDATTPELSIIGFTSFVNIFGNSDDVRYALYMCDNAYLLVIQCADDFRESLNRKLYEVRNKTCAFIHLDEKDNLELHGTMYWIKANKSQSELMMIVTSELDPVDIRVVTEFTIMHLKHSYDLSKSVVNAWLALFGSSFLPDNRYSEILMFVNYNQEDIDKNERKRWLKNLFLRYYDLPMDIDLYRESDSTISSDEPVVSNDECDKEFWHWAFDNAPKALIKEAYNMLYSNMGSQYEKFNQQSDEKVNVLNTPLGQAIEELKCAVGKNYVFLSQIISVLEKIFQVVNSTQTMRDYDIYMIHARTDVSVDLSDFGNVSCVWYFADNYGEYLLFASGDADTLVLVSVSSEAIRTVMDLYNDWEGTSLQQQADTLAELVGIEE